MCNIQTRNEVGELCFFDSVKNAYKAWQDDNTIWKISWSYFGVRFRFVVKMKTDVWSVEGEAKLCKLSESYRNGVDDVFFVNQTISGDIIGVLSEREFVQKCAEV